MRSMIVEEEKSHFHFVAEPGSRGFAYARLLFRKPLLAMFSMRRNSLLACLNRASLLMACSAARERELATPAGHWRNPEGLIEQLLAESLSIAVLGIAADPRGCAPLVSRSSAALLLSGRVGRCLTLRSMCVYSDSL